MRPFKSRNTTTALGSTYHLLNKSINVMHNGNKVISYYPFPKIIALLARLQNCKIFSSLDLRSGYHIVLTSKVKHTRAFATTSGKGHYNVALFKICSSPGVLCYLMSQVLSGLDFCFAYLDDIIMTILVHWTHITSTPNII